jgi:hypothetical protein
MAKATKYIKCEVTGEFIPENESETVRIEIIKKKGVHFKIVPLTENIVTPTFVHTKTETPIETKPKIDPNSLDDVTGFANPKVKKLTRPKSVVPAAFKGMLIPTDDPEFESKGTKITRRV